MMTKEAEWKRQHRVDYVLRKTDEKRETTSLLDARVLADYRATRSWAATARNFNLNVLQVKSSVRRGSAAEHQKR
jgi:hypothetical protein